jgi:hypothetical protein
MNTSALKSIFGAIRYTMLRYGYKEISDHDWQYACSALGIQTSTVYCIELTSYGFLLSTKEMVIKYTDHSMHGERVIDINP